MAEYIERESFIVDQRHLYCDNCARRKGMKNGKMKFVYAIGEAPCRACDIGDMLDSVEDYPAADVVPVRHGEWDDTKVAFYLKCSECGCCVRSFAGEVFLDYAQGWNYCPNCGAHMDKDGDGNGRT